jgi:hypothetical protein
MLLFLPGILFFLNAYAQKSIDLLTLSGRYGLPANLEDVPDSRATESGALVNLKIPVVLSDAGIWYSELSYTWFHVGFDRTLPDTMAAPVALHGFVLQTGLIQRLDDSRKIHLLAAPRFMTDFSNTGADHWQWGGVGLFEKRFHQDLMMRFGILYNQEFFGPFLVPLVYIDWQLSGKWSISGLLPIYGKLNYLVNENLTIGLSEFGLITSYRLGNPAYQGDYIERKSIDLSLFARQRLAGNFYIEGRAGYALSREYGQYASDQKVDLKISVFSFGDDRTRKNVLFEDGPIFNLRMVYNLPLE